MVDIDRSLNLSKLSPWDKTAVGFNKCTADAEAFYRMHLRTFQEQNKSINVESLLKNVSRIDQMDPNIQLQLYLLLLFKELAENGVRYFRLKLDNCPDLPQSLKDHENQPLKGWSGNECLMKFVEFKGQLFHVSESKTINFV